MKPTPELVAKQTQKLVLTPDLRQSLSILQMPVVELETYISQQLFENCLLEQEDINVDANLEETEYFETLSLSYLETKETNNNDETIDNEYLFSENLPDRTLNKANISLEKVYNNLKTTVSSLQDHLIAQLRLTSQTIKEKLLAEFLIGNIGEDGYLQCEITDIAKHFRTSVSEVEDLLQLIQTFDPPGVGARNLSECLLLQFNLQKDCLLESKDLNRDLLELVKVIIEDHLYDIAEARLNKVAAQVRRSISEVQAAVDLIRSLDPKPGRNFGDPRDIRFIIPDVTIKLLADAYLILINEPTSARLFINPLYRQFGHNLEEVDEKTLQYLREKQNSALQLIRSIEQRKTTLYQITQAIIEVQSEFLAKGPRYLRPLTLRQIAELVGIHESTVSRAIAEKYIDTPRGIYPFKYFFTSSLESSAGETVSAESVKKQIRTAIDREDTKLPLSDQQLAEMLVDKGITISRRTVAKYREELMVPSSNKRRRY